MEENSQVPENFIEDEISPLDIPVPEVEKKYETFPDLLDDQDLLATISAVGFTAPTPVQCAAIPHGVKEKT